MCKTFVSAQHTFIHSLLYCAFPLFCFVFEIKSPLLLSSVFGFLFSMFNAPKIVCDRWFFFPPTTSYTLDSTKSIKVLSSECSRTKISSFFTFRPCSMVTFMYQMQRNMYLFHERHIKQTNQRGRRRRNADANTPPGNSRRGKYTICV